MQTQEERIMNYKKHRLNNSFKWQEVTAPFQLISEVQANSWNSEGYFLLENVLDHHTISEVTFAIDPMEAKTNEYLRTIEDKRKFIARADEITFALHPVTKSDTAKKFAQHPVFAQLCLDLLGPTSRLYWDQAVYKKPHCPEEFPWHQDNGYNFVTPQDYLTCWVPLVDATIENGCPWVMPGVHKSGTVEHWQTDLGWQCIKGMTGAVPVEAKAGDVVVFSSLTPHRTGPNRTDIERKSYILQYCHDDSLMFADDQNGIPQDNPDRQFLVTSEGIALQN
jgi:phytanoyl-CoA hydroxylase